MHIPRPMFFILTTCSYRLRHRPRKIGEFLVLTVEFLAVLQSWKMLSGKPVPKRFAYHSAWELLASWRRAKKLSISKTPIR